MTDWPLIVVVDVAVGVSVVVVVGVVGVVVAIVGVVVGGVVFESTVESLFLGPSSPLWPSCNTNTMLKAT